MVNSKNAVMLYDAANVELDNITFIALPPISGFTNDRHFIETYTPDIYAKIISKKHTYYYKNLNLSFIYPYIAPSSSTNFRFIKEDTFDGDPCDVSYDNFNEFKIYAGVVSDTDINRFGSYRGLTKSTLANDYRHIISIAKRAIDAGRTIYVQLLGDIVSQYSSSESTDANVTYPKLHIYSEIGNKKKITTNGGELLLLGDTEFENCNINIVTSGSGFSFANGRQGHNINFKNVNFEIWKSYNMFWNGNYSVKFDNCIFTWVNNAIRFLYMVDTNLPKIEFNSCSYGKSVNAVIDLYIYNQGDTAHRPKVGKIGQRYFDTTLHKPIFVNAIDSTAGITEWIYADGTPVT